MPRILQISSHVVAGRVGNRLAVFALERLGHTVLALPTVVFSHTPGPGGFAGGALPADELDAILQKLEASGEIAALDAVQIGYLRTTEQAAVVAAFLDRIAHSPALIAVDPILGDEDTGIYVEAGVVALVRDRIVPRARLTTPNAFELGLLTGRPVHSAVEAEAGARALGLPEVVVTSVYGDSLAKIGTLALRPTGAVFIETPRLAHPVHGTGDLFASLLLSRRLAGEALPPAAAAAVSSVYALLRAAQAEDAAELPVTERQDLWLEPPVRFTAERR